MMDKQWLEQLRTNRKLVSSSTDQEKEDFIFRLIRQDNRVLLRTMSTKNEEVFPNYQNYAGYERQLLSTLDTLRERQAFVIDWDNPTQDIYLDKHSYLINLLAQCPRVQDEGGRAIVFSKEDARVNFQIENDPQQAGQLTAQHYLFYQHERKEKFIVVTEENILWENHLITVPPMGNGFSNLALFNTSFAHADITFFLSLYYSQISGTHLVYDHFKLEENEEIIEADPCLVFEKVDTDKSLYLLVGQILPELSIDQMQDYPIHRYAQLNELEKRIVLRPVQQQRYDSLLQQIEKMLGKRGRRKSALSFFRENNRFVIEEELAGEFITKHLPSLLQNFRILGAEQLREYKIVARPPQLKMSFSHGIDFLEGNVKIAFDDEEINLFDLIKQYRKQKYILLADGNKAILDEQYVRRLERIFQPNANEGDEDVALSIFDLPLAEELLGQREQLPIFKKTRAVFNGFNDLGEQKAKLPKLKAKLRAYQKYGFKWLDYLREHQLGGCLADDMGLGKTLQAISVLAKVYEAGEERPSIVVCPRSLLQNWRKECEKFAPQLSVHIYYGAQRDWEEALQAQVIVMTYAIMRNDIQLIREQQLCYSVLDESQNIKNMATQTTRAALLIKADHRLALSGTPIENNLGELYALFRFLNPGMFGSPAQFVSNYANPIQRENDQEATAQLRKKIFPFILRRRKVDVLDDLPDKVEQTLFVDMTEKQQKLYETRRRFYQELVEQQVASQGIERSQFVIFQALNELRQIATIPERYSDGQISSAKRELLLEQLEETLANGHKALIFVNFLAAVELLGEDLNKMGVDYVSMTGSTRNRQALVDRFQEDPECRVFLMTLKTGGTGLNLTAASTVFIYDPWWNVAAETQAIDRTHRIGQVNKVHALRLIANGTIEEKIRLLQEKKQALFDSVIGADGASLKKMTEEDINFVLSK